MSILSRDFKRKIILNLSKKLGVDLMYLYYYTKGVHLDKVGEESEIFLVSKVLFSLFGKKDNPVFFDVGANEGTYSNNILNYFNNVKLVAFEPDENNFQKLTSTIKSKNASLVKKALGSEIGEIILFNPEQIGGTSISLYKDVFGNANVSEIKAEMTTIDNYSLQNDIDEIDFIKIDTEGNELEVLKGARKMLSEGKIKCIQFEFNEMNVFSRVFLKDFYDILPEFVFFKMHNEVLLNMGGYSPNNEIFQFQNIFVIHEKYVDEIREFTSSRI